MFKKSFTLIELIVVIAIIAILAAIIAPNAFRAIQKARVARMAADLKTVKTAALMYRTDTGQWPGGYIENNAHPLLSDPGLPGWDGPYMDKPGISPLVKDPGLPFCSTFGIYYLCWSYGCCGGSAPVPLSSLCNLYWRFDLDKDGTAEVTDGIGISVYGFSSVDTVEKLDLVFDGEEVVGPYPQGLRGILNTNSEGCGMSGFVNLFVGNTGVFSN